MAMPFNDGYHLQYFYNQRRKSSLQWEILAENQRIREQQIRYSHSQTTLPTKSRIGGNHQSWANHLNQSSFEPQAYHYHQYRHHHHLIKHQIPDQLQLSHPTLVKQNYYQPIMASSSQPNSRKSSRTVWQEQLNEFYARGEMPQMPLSSPKVRALRRGSSVSAAPRRAELISQHSLQCPLDGNEEGSRSPHNMRRHQQIRTPPEGPAIRKGSGGARSLPFTPNEALAQHYHMPQPPYSAGLNNEENAPQFLLLSKQQFATNNSRANSNPTIGPPRGVVERRINALKRCPKSDLASRFQRHHHERGGIGGMSSRGSSFSNESTPVRSGAEQDSDQLVDPVYLALKQATCKYGAPPSNGSQAGSRRGSQSGAVYDPVETPPSPRNLSQSSLLDSGTYSGSENCGGGSRQRLVSESTPQLHGKNIISSARSSNAERPPKLSEKMKSLSLDCPDAPPPVQDGMRPQYKSKTPVRHAYAGSGENFDKSASPPANRVHVQARRLPPIPGQKPQEKILQPQATNHVAPPPPPPQMLYIVIHEYVHGECSLRPADRVVVVDNGDPDWKHGFKLNDRLEQLLTFPSSCVAAYQLEEQPMQLIQSCNLTDQKLRLYRDQVVFVQPNSLSNDGRVLVRTEHNKFAQCPLQFMTMA